MDEETNIQRVENMIYSVCGCSKEDGKIILEKCLERNKKPSIWKSRKIGNVVITKEWAGKGNPDE